MSNWSDPKVIVAIYAAVVATISLIWNIVVLIKKSKRILYLKTDFNLSFTNSVMGSSPVFGLISIEMTNIGDSDINIKSTCLNFCGKKITIMGMEADSIECKDLQNPNKYPKSLKKGDIFKDDMDTKGIIKSISDQLNEKDKIRIIVRDTLGKKYKSKRFTYGQIITCENQANEYNRQHGN